MLKEDQVRELLHRCESIAGRQLKQTRGNLKKTGSRASAIFELLVTEELGRQFVIEIEPQLGSTPDLLVCEGDERVIVEAAYLYPRYWENDRKEREILRAIAFAARKKGIENSKIIHRFDAPESSKGYLRDLPRLQDISKFKKDPRLLEFLEASAQAPFQRRTIVFPELSVSLLYEPNQKSRYSFGQGVCEEQPTALRENNLYRTLKAKAQQHKIELPYLVVVGSDVSDATRPSHPTGRIQREDVISKVFSDHPK